ncbi:gamma-glutamyltransferase [Thiocapsa marina]|uniref:Glutathione hydrolase proenzyme n=1 Tax=Thiocapsa marina 5811 TaxID=768671 RepID=F9UCJ9_9GAMM|nr:gamma-glutamyltransferase [Thiocapsa marina]EGV18112.1 gamma-glutamyltransferase [Thiocapsa marina 5811]
MSVSPARADRVRSTAGRIRAFWRGAAWIAALLLASAGVRAACDGPQIRPDQAAIASAHPLATEAGLKILEAGGNAFDAAVAVTAALAVVEPYGSGIGGGGFWLLHRAQDCLEIMLDGRERAPLAAHRDLFLDDAGQFDPAAALDGPLSAGIPGTPAALVQLAEQYGRVPLAQTLAPAIGLARDGFEIGDRYRRVAAWRLSALRASPAATAQFLLDGEVPPRGHRLHQPDLADTLERLASDGHAGFYAGETAERLISGVRAAGGIWTPEDLAEYRAVEREPIVGSFRGWRIVSAAPPSSGGVLLVQILNMLSAIEPRPESGAARIHALTESMRRAYRDRARYLGDPDHVQMPIERLTHPYYAAGLIRDVDPTRATPSTTAGTDTASSEGRDTTHFSILDREGNRVAATLSINYPFGSGFVPPGTGVLLNDEMDDFSAQPGVANAYGLVGGEANAIAPGKRMLSSMSPTFLESRETVAILGTPGGSRIITMVLQGILGVVDGVPLEDWIAQPRIHHQYLPDRLEFESGALSPAELGELTAMGHRLELLSRPIGDMQAIVWDRANGQVKAASDPRGAGHAEVR